MNNDYIIVFIYTNKDLITSINLDSIKLNNPHTKIIDINKNDFHNIHFDFLGKKPITQWSVRELWYSCDTIFLYWYLSNQHIRAKNYIIVEWDTFCYNTSFIDFFGDEILNNRGLLSAKTITKNTHPNDYWFTQQKNNNFLNNELGLSHIKKYSPMSCSTISDGCVLEIINFIKHNPEANSIYIETKFASIASFLGYEIKSYNNNLSEYISYHENITAQKLAKLSNNGQNKNFQGIFHPIKKYNIYRKYFMPNNIINNDQIKIISAIYGSGIDLQEDITHIFAQIDEININNDIGGDPAPYKKKYLFLTYEKNGQIYKKIIPESSVLNKKTL